MPKKPQATKKFPLLTLNNEENGTAHRYVNRGYVVTALMQLKIYALHEKAKQTVEALDEMLAELNL